MFRYTINTLTHTPGRFSINQACTKLQAKLGADQGQTYTGLPQIDFDPQNAV